MSNVVVADPDRDHQDSPLPPHDLAAEQTLLGAMMLSVDAIGEVTETMGVGDFYRPAHATIFETILDLYGGGAPTDVIALSAELARRGDLIRVGGAPYLHTLMSSVPTASNAGYYAELVADRAQERRLVSAGMRITQIGYGGAGQGAEIAELLDKAQAALDDVIDDRAGAGYTLFTQMRAARLAELDDVQAGRVPPGLPTGFADLDAVIGGLRPGQLVVIAARPGLGKTALAVDMARNASVKRGQTSVIFSLEMTEAELWHRVIAAEAKVRLTAMTTPGALSAADLDRIVDAHDRIDAGGALVIDDTSSLTVTQIRAKARRIRARHGLGLVVVDYLQLMTSGRRVESRQVEVSEFSRQLKILAKELEVPVVALSQLNRSPEQRADKRPMLADLRESGALEQDSDVVVLIHRPDVYETNSPRAGEADLIVAKNRSGPTAWVTVAHQLHYCRFADMARQP
jgi:replicative DNA helicase